MEKPAFPHGWGLLSLAREEALKTSVRLRALSIPAGISWELFPESAAVLCFAFPRPLRFEESTRPLDLEILLFFQANYMYFLSLGDLILNTGNLGKKESTEGANGETTE